MFSDPAGAAGFLTYTIKAQSANVKPGMKKNRDFPETASSVWRRNWADPKTTAPFLDFSYPQTNADSRAGPVLHNLSLKMRIH